MYRTYVQHMYIQHALHGTASNFPQQVEQYNQKFCSVKLLHRQPIVYFRVASLFSCMFVY